MTQIDPKNWPGLMKDCRDALRVAEETVAQALAALARGEKDGSLIDRLDEHRLRFDEVKALLVGLREAEPEARRAWNPLWEEEYDRLLHAGEGSVDSLNRAIGALMEQVALRQTDSSDRLGRIRTARKIIEGWSREGGPQAPRFFDDKG